MIRVIPLRSRQADPENFSERYKGIVSLPKTLFPEDQARNLEAKRWVESENSETVSADDSQAASVTARPFARSTGTDFAQVAIPIPRFFPLLPPLRYNGRRRGSPPRGPGPQSRRRSEEECDAEYARNLAQCDAYYPKASYPGLDLDPEGRGNCRREAFRVFSACRTGRETKPFDPTLFYEE